jgi:Ca-activated chloride channel family protein
MTFADPLWLWALLALPLLALAEAAAVRRDRERTSRLVARALWDRVLRRPHPRWRHLRVGLLLLGAAGVLLALARPQWGIVREKVEREGVDVVLVLDTSGSMATEDVPPSRFFLARAALMSLVSRLEGDRFALVAFEGEAYPLVPLTLDADAVGLFLETTEPGIVPGPGSSLGSGLAKGLELFVDRERRNKAMVLCRTARTSRATSTRRCGSPRRRASPSTRLAWAPSRGSPCPTWTRKATGSATRSRKTARRSSRGCTRRRWRRSRAAPAGASCG